MTVTPQTHLDGGIAGYDSEQVLADQVDFIGGDQPELFTTVETVLSGQVLAAREVVGFDANGKIVKAEAGSVEAIGVTTYAVDASAGDVETSIYRGGNFKPSALTFDAATYTTDALIAKAFEGAPSPTQIVLTETRQFAV